MPAEAVLDASAIAALYTPEAHSGWVRDAVRRHRRFHILDLTFYEVSNALWKKLLLREMKGSEMDRALRGAWKFMDTLCLTHSHKEVRERSLEASIRYALTIYDSSYLALAENLGVKLITVDMDLHERLRETPLDRMLVHP
ncbi:MAG: type II toxin-antitoxin system VapC family toxin [Candidatus Bathyarchaeia archaeon]|nr:type II toxin-antitoxin system VapC family toxin [Candidatus Bathyarchaeota archaeon]